MSRLSQRLVYPLTKRVHDIVDCKAGTKDRMIKHLDPDLVYDWDLEVGDESRPPHPEARFMQFLRIMNDSSPLGFLNKSMVLCPGCDLKNFMLDRAKELLRPFLSNHGQPIDQVQNQPNGDLIEFFFFVNALHQLTPGSSQGSDQCFGTETE